MQIVVIRYFMRFRVWFNLTRVLIVTCTVAGWLIYGNIIYFSDTNNCRQIEETKGLATLMIVILAIGYFYFILIGFFLCCVPCIIYALISSNRHAPEELGEEQIIRIARSL